MTEAVALEWRGFEQRGVRTFLRRTLPHDCLVVLAFHRVGDELPPWHFGITPARLERVATTFASVARPVSLGEVLATGIRGRMLVLTFDDGFADNAEVAAPLLSRLGLPGAFFLTVDGVERGTAPWPDEAYARVLELPEERLVRLALHLAPGRPARTPLEAAHSAVHGMKGLPPERRARLLRALPDARVDPGRMMTWEQARRLAVDGFEVGSHGLTHAPLTTVDDDQLAWELEGSRRAVAEGVGIACDLIAYPDSRSDARVEAATARAGYRLGLAAGQRVNLPDASVFSVQRLSAEDTRLWAIAARASWGPRATVSFAAEAERYAASRADEYSFVTQARLVVAAMSPRRPHRVLDAGCGAGALVSHLRAVGANEIVGVDASPEMVEAARRRYPKERWIQADVARLPFPARSFDAAISLGVVEYVADPAVVLRELARVTRRGAPLVVSVPQRYSPNALALRAAELAGRGLREGSRPLTPRDLERAAAAAVLEVCHLRATNFFAFPVTNVFPRFSRRVAELLDPLGRAPLMRRLGGQLVAELRRPARRPLFWLVPALPTDTTFLDRELRALRRLGVEVEPLAPPLGPEAVLAFARRPLTALRLAVELQRLKAQRDKERGRIGYLVLFVRGLTLAERLEGKPGRIHAGFADGVGTIAYVAARLTGRPYSFTAHSPYSLWQRSRLLARQALAADVVVCESATIARELADIAPEARLRVVPAPAPESAPPRVDAPGTPLLLCVARLIPHKGVATAIDAVAIATERGYDVRLDVLGDGPEWNALERLIEERGMGSRVRLVGATPNDIVLERLAGALALLAPCEIQSDGDRDGLPVSIIDAAWCGTPVIATPVGAIPDLVVDGESGLLVPERDAHALADAIARLVDDPELAGRLGRGARDAALQLHDPQREARSLLELWRDVDAGD